MTLNSGLFSHQASETWSEDLGWKPSIWHINFQRAPSFLFIILPLYAFIYCPVTRCVWADLICSIWWHHAHRHIHTHTQRHPWTDKEKKTKKKMFTYWQKLSFCSNDSELQGVYLKRPLKFGVKIGFLAGTLMGRLMALLLKASSPNPNCLRFDQLLSWHDPNPSCRLMKTPFGRLAMLPPPLTKRGSVLGGIAKHLSRVPK